jgi:hypothetical protein
VINRKKTLDIVANDEHKGAQMMPTVLVARMMQQAHLMIT